MPYDNTYTVDWNRLVRIITPPFLRRPKLLAFLYAGASGFARLHSSLLNYRRYVNYRLSITPQVCRLLVLLNDKWDATLRRIFITRGIEYSPLLLALDAENKPQKLPLDIEGKLLLPTDSELAFFSVDFTINIPQSVVYNESELRAYIEDDVLPSKVYNIKTF